MNLQHSTITRRIVRGLWLLATVASAADVPASRPMRVHLWCRRCRWPARCSTAGRNSVSPA